MQCSVVLHFVIIKVWLEYTPILYMDMQGTFTDLFFVNLNTVLNLPLCKAKPWGLW